MNIKDHSITFVIKNKSLKKEYVEKDFQKASELFEHKQKQHTKGRWQLIAKVC